MSTALLPDLEVAAIAWLKEDARVNAVVGTRVYPSPPDNVNYPYVKVFTLPGRTLARHWLAQAVLQVEGWAHHGKTSSPSGRLEAREACETAVAVLHDAQNVLVGDCWVLSVLDVRTARELPDRETDHHRFVAEVLVTYHADLGS